jgi:hypothetical protein
MLGDYIDVQDGELPIFTNMVLLREIMENARAGAPQGEDEHETRQNEEKAVYEALEEKAGYTRTFIDAALALKPDEILRLSFREQVHIESLQELFTSEIPLFTRDSQGDPQLAPTYLSYISAIETAKARESLYPERDGDKGYRDPKTGHVIAPYDGRKRACLALVVSWLPSRNTSADRRTCWARRSSTAPRQIGVHWSWTRRVHWLTVPSGHEDRS